MVKVRMIRGALVFFGGVVGEKRGEDLRFFNHEWLRYRCADKVRFD